MNNNNFNEYAPIAHYLPALARYIDSGIPLGSFHRAVVDNDLKGACRAADSTNINYIPLYVRWLSNHAPMICWGRDGAHDKWILTMAEAKEAEESHTKKG